MIPLARTTDRMRESLRHPSTTAFAVLLVVGLVLRAVVAFSPLTQLDSDRAVVYLMARHAADGELTAFFWGQSYGGALLSWTGGLLAAVAGPSIELLSIVSALFWAGAAIVLRNVVSRSAGRSTGDLAGVLFWFPGVVILTTSVADPGFYGPSLLIGLAAIQVSVSQSTALPRRWWSWAILGILAGLALWTSPMAVAFAVPAVILAMIGDRRWKLWLLGAGFALVAASAWISETVASRLSSVKPLGGASFHPESLASIFTSMLPAAYPGGQYELVAFVVALGAVACIVGLSVAAVRSRDRGLFALAVGTVLMVGVLVAGSGVRLAPDSVRYAGFLLPGLAVAVALVASRMRWSAVAVGVLAVLITTGLVGQRTEGLKVSAATHFDPALTRVGEFLEDRGVTAAYGSYWAAYSLSAVTEERVTVASIAPRRYTPYEEAARGDEPEAIVVFAGAANDEILQDRTDLPLAERTVIGGYAVYIYDDWFDPYALPLELF